MLQLVNANNQDIIILISNLISEIEKRDNNHIGVKQALSLLNTSKTRIETKQEAPEAEARSLYQTLSSIFLFEQLQFTNQEYELLKAIEKFSQKRGAKGGFETLFTTNAWRKPF